MQYFGWLPFTPIRAWVILNNFQDFYSSFFSSLSWFCLFRSRIAYQWVNLSKRIAQKCFLLRISLISKETLVQVFSWEFCEIFKNTLFTEQLRATVSTMKHFIIHAVTVAYNTLKVIYKKQQWHCPPTVSKWLSQEKGFASIDQLVWFFFKS